MKKDANRGPTQVERTRPRGRRAYHLSEVAEALGGLSYRHVRRLVATGELRATNVSIGTKPSYRVSSQALAACRKRRRR